MTPPPMTTTRARSGSAAGTGALWQKSGQGPTPQETRAQRSGPRARLRVPPEVANGSLAQGRPPTLGSRMTNARDFSLDSELAETAGWDLDDDTDITLDDDEWQSGNPS